MALQIDIVNISAATYPIDVYVCSGCPSESCVLVDTISSVPELITIPAPYDTYDSFAVKIVGSNGCEICETFENATPSICDTCNIGFNFYDTNPIGVISVGIITGSCDSNITDYIIEWYGPGPDSTNVSFTSGLGSDYLGEYLYSQPLTGVTQIPVLAGIYTPVIAKIKINGVEYFNLRCFDSVTVLVDPLTCDNGVTSTLPQYDHKLRYSANVNQTPQPVATTFILNPTNPYFAFRFEGEVIFDSLEIKFIGSSYSDPIIIESISQGVSLDKSDFSLLSVPKKAKTYSYVQPSRNNFSKVLNLSNFDINVDDYLEIKITPNTGNTNTNWAFYCKCLETFNCNVCDDLNITYPYRIIQSTIQNNPIDCFARRISLSLSGCTNSDIKRYMMTDSVCCAAGVDNANTVWFENIYSFLGFGTDLNYTPIFTCGSGNNFIINPPCAPFSTSTITYNKSVVGSEGLLSMTFSSYDDFLVYWNDWQTKYMSYSGNPSNCNDFLGYYRKFNLRIPKSQGSEQCGDSTVFNNYAIHPSSIVTSGGTGPWNMSITMKTITNCFIFSGCNSACTDSLNTFFVNPINDSATGTSNNYTGTTNTGSKLTTPITSVNLSLSSTTIQTTINGSADIYIPKYINETIPYSGTPLTTIPSLSAQTCNFSTWGFTNYGDPSKNLGFYGNESFSYQIRLINPSNDEDFEIWTYIPSVQKIYQYSGGSVNFINSSYFV